MPGAPQPARSAQAGSASRTGGLELEAASSQAPRDWDRRSRPSSRPRWRKLPKRREGARAGCFPPAGRAGRWGGVRAPEEIARAGSSILVGKPLAAGLGAPRNPRTQSPALPRP